MMHQQCSLFLHLVVLVLKTANDFKTSRNLLLHHIKNSLHFTVYPLSFKIFIPMQKQLSFTILQPILIHPLKLFLLFIPGISPRTMVLSFLKQSIESIIVGKMHNTGTVDGILVIGKLNKLTNVLGLIW